MLRLDYMYSVFEHKKIVWCMRYREEKTLVLLGKQIVLNKSH